MSVKECVGTCATQKQREKNVCFVTESERESKIERERERERERARE